MNRIQATVLFIIVSGVMLSLASGFKEPFGSKPEGSTVASNTPDTKTSEPERPYITLGMFESIGPPLRYDELTPLIGPGTLVSQYYSQGLITQGYRWENPDHSFMHLVIQNGQVVSKQQVGLR